MVTRPSPQDEAADTLPDADKPGGSRWYATTAA
jgi:hypothetical protein